MARRRPVCDDLRRPSSRPQKDDMIAVIGNCIAGLLALSLFAATLRLSR